MKKQLILLNFISSMLLADSFINPLPSSVRSIDNGGIKQAIDAYKDGIGVELMDKPGVVTDNAAMNTLVYKYGEAAKISNKTILNEVSGTSGISSYDLNLASKLATDGTLCNDGNNLTINDIYTNGICSGTIPAIPLYDNCEGGTKNWPDAKAFCLAKGMRLATTGEITYYGGQIPSCSSGFTWTQSTSSVDNYWVWYHDTSLSQHNIAHSYIYGGSYGVRCVRP